MLRALLFSLFLGSLACAATPELRGVWVTTTGITSSTSTVYSRAAVNTNFARLRAIGLNTVYMDTWRNGGTYFNSQTVQAVTGSAIASDAGGRDLFADTLIAAHRNGMEQYAWLQYGFAAQFLDVSGSPSNSLATYMKNKGWLLQDSSGKYSNSSNKYAWMNPLVPEVRQFIIGMGVELAQKYDLDGIQFDDRLAWPVQFGYDTYTTNAYLAATGRTTMPAYNDAAFIRWRADQVTDFAKQFSAAIRAVNPSVRVAAAPGGYSDTYSTLAADAAQWSRTDVTVNGTTTPIFNEITPQIYSSIPSNFNGVWNQNLAALDPADKASYAVGISINGSSGAYDWATINKPQVDYARTTGTAGHIWWYSDGVLNSDEAKLTAYYNAAATGQAARPDHPADWRPTPVVASAAGVGTWTATLAESAERYEVIARTGDAWTIVADNVFAAGARPITTGGRYDSVEFLVDRRGFIPGDLNFDQQVNFDDLLTLSQNYNHANALWTNGDFTLDGTVDFADLLILAQHWGDGVPPSAQLMSFETALAMVPEPGTILLFALFVGRRNARRK